jgi:uncharacterized membrane protein required for colicin V production
MKQYLAAVNLFDGVLLVTLIAGLIRGRKRGMSEEVLDLLKWLLILTGVAFGYQPLGQLIARFTPLPPLFANVFAYLFIVAAGYALFGALRHAAGEKLFGSDTFGPLEYPLGMLAGAGRFFCVMLVILALINARLITDVQHDRQQKEALELYGSVYFPTLGSLQRTVFVYSLSGPYIAKYFSRCLIAPTPYEGIIDREHGPGRRREKELDAVIDGRRKR